MVGDQIYDVDQLRVERARFDEVGDKAVLECGTHRKRPVIAVPARTPSLIVEAPHLLRLGRVGVVRDIQRVRHAVAVGIQQAHRAAGCAEDGRRQRKHRRAHVRLARFLVDLLLLPGDGVRDVGAHVADLDGVVPLKQHVRLDLDDLGLCLHAKLRVSDRHRVAQVALFEQREVLVLGKLLELDEGRRDARFRDADLVVFDILFRALPELLRRRLFLKIAGKIHRHDAREVVRARRVDDLRVARHEHTLGVCPVRIDAGRHAGDVAVLLDVCQVFPVADHDAVVVAALTVQADREAVPLILSAVHVEDRAGRPAEHRARRRRHRDSKRRDGRLVRPEGERAVHRRVEAELRERVRRVDRCKRVERHAGKVVGDMLRIHHDDAVHRPRDPVDAERLRRPVRARDRIDDAAVRDLVEMHAGVRVLHRQLEGAVALLGDRAADRIRQDAETVRGKLRRGGREKDRFHIISPSISA